MLMLAALSTDSNQKCVCVIKSLEMKKPTRLQAQCHEKHLVLVAHVLILHLN